MKNRIASGLLLLGSMPAVSAPLIGSEGVGGGGLGQAVKYEREQVPPDQWLSKNVLEGGSRDRYFEGFAPISENYLRTLLQYSPELAQSGLRIIYYLFLGGYFKESTQAVSESHFIYLASKGTVANPAKEARYSYVGEIKINGGPADAANDPASSVIWHRVKGLSKEGAYTKEYDPGAFWGGGDCEDVFIEENGLKKCQLVMSSLVGTHELLSLTGLEGTNSYPASIILRHLLFDQDPDSSTFAKALTKGLRDFYFQDRREDPLIAYLKDIESDPKNPYVEIYSRTVWIRVRLLKDAQTILYMNRNQTVIKEITSLIDEMIAQLREIDNRYGKFAPEQSKKVRRFYE